MPHITERFLSRFLLTEGFSWPLARKYFICLLMANHARIAALPPQAPFRHFYIPRAILRCNIATMATLPHFVSDTIICAEQTSFRGCHDIAHTIARENRSAHIYIEDYQQAKMHCLAMAHRSLCCSPKNYSSCFQVSRHDVKAKAHKDAPCFVIRHAHRVTALDTTPDVIRAPRCPISAALCRRRMTRRFRGTSAASKCSLRDDMQHGREVPRMPRTPLLRRTSIEISPPPLPLSWEAFCKKSIIQVSGSITS